MDQDTNRPSAAPTEAEIRAAIQARLDHYPLDDPRKKLKAAIEDIAGILTGPAFDLLESPDPRDDESSVSPEDLWADLRPSEAIILRRKARTASARALDGALNLIIDEIVAAGLAVAREIPDAPRPRPARVATRVGDA